VRLEASVADACDANASCKIVSVARKRGDDDHHDRDESEAVRGSHHDDDRDWVITGDLTLKLRAKRGRVYVVSVKCTDASGTASRKAVTVRVRRDDDD
jgi:hypothetical protein